MVASRISILILSLKDDFPKEKIVCQIWQVKFKYLGTNSVQIVHEGASFVKK